MNIKVDVSKIAELARLTGCHAWEIRKAIGLPIRQCRATTLKGARKSFWEAKINSSHERVARSKWDELSITAIQESHTLEQLKTLEVNISESLAVEVAFRKKVDMIAIEQLRMADTKQKLLSLLAFKDILNDHCRTEALGKLYHLRGI